MSRQKLFLPAGPPGNGYDGGHGDGGSNGGDHGAGPGCGARHGHEARHGHGGDHYGRDQRCGYGDYGDPRYGGRVPLPNPDLPRDEHDKGRGPGCGYGPAPAPDFHDQPLADYRGRPGQADFQARREPAGKPR